MRLSVERRGRARTARQNTDLPLSAFCFRFFLSFVLSVIRAEAALANASTGICLLRLRMERRMKSAVTVSNAAVKELGRKAASRECEFIRLSPLGRGRLASKSGEGARMFKFSSSVPPHPYPLPIGEREEGSRVARIPSPREAVGRVRGGGHFNIVPPPRLISLT